LTKSTVKPGSFTKAHQAHPDPNAVGAIVELEQRPAQGNQLADCEKELCTTDALREIGAKGFNKTVADLVERGWGGSTDDKAPSYTAERVMP